MRRAAGRGGVLVGVGAHEQLVGAEALEERWAALVEGALDVGLGDREPHDLASRLGQPEPYGELLALVGVEQGSLGLRGVALEQDALRGVGSTSAEGEVDREQAASARRRRRTAARAARPRGARRRGRRPARCRGSTGTRRRAWPRSWSTNLKRPQSSATSSSAWMFQRGVRIRPRASRTSSSPSMATETSVAPWTALMTATSKPTIWATDCGDQLQGRTGRGVGPA